MEELFPDPDQPVYARRFQVVRLLGPCEHAAADELVERLAAIGLRPATARELLSFAVQYPRPTRPCGDIYALGGLARLGEETYALGIWDRPACRCYQLQIIHLQGRHVHSWFTAAQSFLVTEIDS